MAVKLGNGNWAVKEDKLLAYNDNSGLFFNKEFDFSRGTSATYVAKDGLIKTAGIQPNIVNNGDFSELGSELVTNGDFSDGSSSWVAEGGSSTWVIDNVANKISSSNFALYQNITRTVGKIYKISFDIVEYTSGSLSVSLGNGASTSFNTAGSKTVYKEWDGSDDRVIFRSSFIGKIDNVSVKQVDPNNYWTLGGEAIIDNGLVSFVSASNTYSYIRQDVSSLAASLYRISIEVKNYVSGAVQVGFQGSSPNLQNLNVSADGVYTVELSPNANGDDLEISREFAGGAFDFDVDNVTVQEIQTDTPRIDFTNDTKGHLLLEPSRTNSVPYSNDFSQHALTGGSITSNNIVSPDGSINADTFVEDTNNSQHKIREDISVTSGTYTMSCFVKGTDRFISFYPQGVSTAYAVFDIANESVTASGGSDYVDSQIQSFENDWYRCSLTYNVGTGTSYTHIYLSNSSTSPAPTYTGNGSEMSFYGLQLEQGDFSTSLINTTGAASTRNADLCNNSGSAQDFNDSEGVLYAEIAALANDLTVRKITLSDGDGNPQIAIGYDQTSNIIRCIVFDGTFPVDVVLTTTYYDILNYHKIAIKYKSGDSALWVDGIKVDTSTNAFTITSPLNNLNFNDGGGSSAFYGKVRNVQVFTEALTDEQLEKLTS